MKEIVLPMAVCVLAVAVLGGCSRAERNSEPKVGQGDLQEAIKARTEVTLLQQDCLKLDSEVLEAMRKVVTKADAKQMEGNILLTKDKYDDSVEAFKEAARLYRLVVDGRKLLEKLAKAEKAAATARMLAESSATEEQLKEPKRLQVNAEGYREAGEVEQALAELGRAQKAYEALLPSEGPATLEQAVVARTLMLAARDQIKGLPALKREQLRTFRRGRERDRAGEKAPKPGSLSDLLGRAVDAEQAGANALEERKYAPARSLFAAAEKLYHDAAVLQGKRERVQASRESVESSMKLADAAFKTAARPASFERGKQALSDADKALQDDDLAGAKKYLGQAAEHFATAREEAEKLNALTDAQEKWLTAVAAADEDLLRKHVAKQWQAAKTKAQQAQTKAGAGEVEAATALFTQATGALSDAADDAKTKENLAQAAPIVRRLEQAVVARRKFQAEQFLGQLQSLIPADTRLSTLQTKVAALPWPRQVKVQLAKGVSMEFVYIRPGSFMMGSEKNNDEKPVHKVTITKPFYIGKYEVTQEQWQALTGKTPSNFKGPKNPVDTVSWNECKDFLAKLKDKMPGHTFRLPTEAEWEYSCRAGTSTEYCYGDAESTLGEYAWYTSNSGRRTHPVGTKKPNAWGLYDMHGNVWEWCEDRYDSNYYKESPAKDPTGPSSGSSRVLRGGAWNDGARDCRSASRNLSNPGNRYYFNGFRVVVSVR